MDNYYSETAKVLEELLKGRQFRIEPPPQGSEPLFLILTLPPDVIGFAALNNKLEEHASQSLEKIRDLYAIYAKDWADFDLSLVFCGAKLEEELISKIELDAYFCRKFVIDINKNLKDEFGRLPFIPLSPESIKRISGLERPVSAQTYLIKHGLSSELAKYLAVPHELGERRIIEKCLSGELIAPKWITEESGEFQPLGLEGRKKIRLKKIEINDFRAYKGKHEFDLDGDLIILYGPNGFGKTSFFDAIDFICTGGVARFDERTDRKADKLKKLLSHLDSEVESSYVKMTVFDDDKEFCIERNLRDLINAKIGEEFVVRKEALMKISGLIEEFLDLRIENFVNLFRATHLFGQQYQALTEGLRDHSRLPVDTVSRMLAFQDYVEAIRKSNKVSEELERDIEQKVSEYTFIKESLKSKKKDVLEIKEFEEIAEKPESIQERGKEILDRLSNKLGRKFELSGAINKAIVTGWRGILEEFIGQATEKLATIKELEDKFSEFLENRKKLKDSESFLDKEDETLLQLVNESEDKKNKVKAFEEKIQKLLVEESNFYRRVEAINWVLETKPEIENLKNKIGEANKNKKQNQAIIFELSQEIGKGELESKRNFNFLNKIQEEVASLEGRLKKLSKFGEEAEAVFMITNAGTELRKKLEANKNILNVLEKQLSKKSNELQILTKKEESQKMQLVSLQQSQSELQNVCDKLRRYINSKVCPVCGASHKSKQELLDKLKIQRGNQPKEIGKNSELLALIEARIKKVKNEMIAIELKKMKAEELSSQLEKELEKVEKKVKQFNAEAASFEIKLGTDSTRNIVNKLLKDLKGQIESKQKDLLEYKKKVQILKHQLEPSLMKKKELEQRTQFLEDEIVKLQTMVDGIANEALRRQVSLELNAEKAQEEIQRSKECALDLKNKIALTKETYNNTKKELSNIMDKINREKKEREETEKNISQVKKFFQQIERFATKLNLSLKELELVRIQDLKKEWERKSASFDVLLSEILNFENAMDKIEQSAVLIKTQREINELEKRITLINKQKEDLESWLRCFQTIISSLESLQGRALKEYTSKYGPLTSAIQKRLRSVYGFGEIKLVPEEGEIKVSVLRKNENIYPSDYYSESQMQIIMLSLFLSATLTQNWSSFTPILLDDPVTHFDDLNVYSLLDLVKGLINESDNKKQFIISTCEDRFFRLMKQKFSKINNRVIFYIFESFGNNGPRITKMENH